MEEGVDGLLRDKTPLALEPVAKIVGLTHTSLPHAATHWTLRAMAKAVGVPLRGSGRSGRHMA